MVLAGVCNLTPAAAMDSVTYKTENGTRTVQGKVRVTAEDGGLLLLTQDGALERIEHEKLVQRTKDETPFRPFTSDEMAQHVLKELPRGFESLQTTHYVICHNTSRAYAGMCGALFERLYRAFGNFWSYRKFDLHEPDFPLVAVIFSDHDAYVQHAKSELGEAAKLTIGYYSLHTNRMNMVDLTGVANLRARGGRASTTRQIKAMLSQPGAERTLATVVHEATHQIAFNCGLQTRYADIPVWVSEGIAMYFETPDMRSDRGWSSIGQVNSVRLDHFRKYFPERGADSLKSLIVDDRRFRIAQQANVAYGEAWALVFYLMKRDERKFVAYLKTLAAKSQLQWDQPEDRLREFVQVFGPLDELDTRFVRVIRTLR